MPQESPQAEKGLPTRKKRHNRLALLVLIVLLIVAVSGRVTGRSRRRLGRRHK